MTDSLLVSTDWLAENLDAENLRIIDIRGHVLPATDPPPHYFSHHMDYEEAHIPGAVFVDWTRDITNPDSPNGTGIAKPEAYAELMSRLGIGPQTFVVAYDDASGMFAARFWWTLRYYGHENAAILDGGWDRWTLEGHPITAEVLPIAPTTFTPRPNPALRCTINQVEAALHGDTVLMDVRTPGEFEGKSSRAKRAGHIPGAINIPRGKLKDEAGSLLSRRELQERFAEAGITEDSEQIIIYCNAGVSASYGLLALHVAGITNATVYDGSWKEWGNDEDRPIET